MNFTYSYDDLGRFSKFYLNGTDKSVLIDYDFANAKNRTSTDTITYKTTQIAKEKIEDRAYSYTYDEVGNITQIKEKPAGSTSYGVKVSYTYDRWGQLVRENNVDLNKTIVYTYDAGGNITKRTEYPYTTGTVGTATKTVNYTYGAAWKDKLTKYDGQTISYDEIGNPETYRDGMTFTWQGRQMKTANLNGTSVTYKYNADGLRTYKKVGSTVHEYEYNGGRLYYEKRGNLQFYYRYDAMGNLATITRLSANGDIFNAYVICNSRGDVEELRHSTGELYARYVYDSWGNVIHIYDANGAEITSTTALAVQNPIRYRGYYYDAESGLYYLQSRYYDPVTGRFLNADSLVDTSDVLGFNMYTYCGNNPVNYSDPTGMFWEKLENSLKNGWNRFKSWLKSTFVVESTISYTYHSDVTEFLPEPLPITVKTDTRISGVIGGNSDSSKPVSVYYNVDISNIELSTSAGIKINSKNVTVDVNFGTKGIQILGTSINGNSENSFGVTYDFNRLHMEIEQSSAIVWDGTTTGTYTTVGVDMWIFAPAFFKMPVTQSNWSPARVYAY